MYYRKYRSQTIAEIDNAEIRETLGKSLLDNNFSHAYLLVGTRGSGKTSMARLIAKVVNCTGRKKGEEPCNKCESCVAITDGRALDVIEIDAASNTGVDDIRDLREKVKLAPVQGKNKIYIIDEVHMLSTSAFNALLKTLEEPPEHVIFVLATTDPQKLPETIVSRCLVYDFKTASKDELVRSLSRVVTGEKIKVSSEVLEKIAELGRGSFRDAQKILEQLAMGGEEITLEKTLTATSESSYQTALLVLKAISDRDSKEILKIIEDFSETGGGVENLIEEILKAVKAYLLTSKGLAKEKFSFAFSDSEINQLVSGLLSAFTATYNCPISQLPLETMLVEFIGSKENTSEKVVKQETVEETHEEKVIKSENKKSEESISKEVPEKIKSTEVGENQTSQLQPTTGGSLSMQTVLEKWPEILVELKPHNHSLVAFLRACRPKEMVGDTLVIEVFYKFHRDKLSEQRTREIFEDVVSTVLNAKIKAKFELSEKKPE